MSSNKNDKKYNAEITKEDKKALGDKSGNLRNDGGDDSLLKNRKKPVDFEGKDLDVPGRKLPENKTKKKLKDEENQLYSLGGDEHEDLEEDTDRIN
jgi:hypothetical protein